jgi:hypothetical protein
MGYPRGRSLTEVIVAVVFIGFLTGFVAVLCIGNFFRAKQAMERQKQRRVARLSSAGGGNDIHVSIGGIDSSPRSHYSSGGSTRTSEGIDENQHLLYGPSTIPRRRANVDDNEDANDLLLFNEQQNRRQPTVMRV